MDLPPITYQYDEHVDATPDAGLPLRILRAHRARCDVKYEVYGLDEAARLTYEMLNEHQDQRAAILDGAIATLEEAG